MAFFKKYALLFSMFIGIVLFPWLSKLQGITHYLILIMLYFTFLKVDPKRMRLCSWHGWLLLFQIVVSIGLYFALNPVNHYLAEGAMLCVLMPTATAASVITQRLGGDIEKQTTYTLISNLAVALLVPALFPYFEPSAHLDFWTGFLTIIRRVFPVLMGPFFAAWLTFVIYQHTKHKVLTLNKFWTGLPFYVWVCSLAILMASTTYSLVHDDYNWWIAVLLAVISLITCLVQFFVGKGIGRVSERMLHSSIKVKSPIEAKLENFGTQEYLNIQTSNSIAAGQALGQKNTILGIWLATAYLSPLVALAPCAYIFWQNIFNAIQLARKASAS